MKQLLLLVLCIAFTSCNTERAKQKVIEFDVQESKKELHQIIDAWHKAAADANFDAYFSKMTSNGIFIGTDASENWQMDAFKAFSKPYFDKGKAWSFTALERNIYFSEDYTIAWFDELLDTQMELCRGSGVLHKENNQWKIAHYVLSIAIPNDNVKDVIQLKKERDSIYKTTLQPRK